MALVNEATFANNAGVTSFDVTVPSTTAGNLLTLCVGTKDAPDEVTGITGGGTWQRAVTAGTGGLASQAAEIWYCMNSSAGVTTVSVTLTGNTRVVAWYGEFSGLATSAALDVTAATVGASTTPSPGAITPSQATGLALGMCQFANTSTTVSSGPTGWTRPTSGNVESAAGSASGTEMDAAYKIDPGTSSDTPTWTIGTSRNWGAAVAIFKPAAGGTTPVSTTRSTTWDVLAQVSAAKVASWDTRAEVSASRVASYDVLASVSATREATWDTLAPVDATRATTWDVRAEVAASRVASWDTLAQVSAARVASWDTLATVSAARSTTWNVESSLIAVSTTRETTWRVLAQVAGTREASWDTRAVVEASRATTWRVLAAITAARATTWRVLAALTTDRVASWRTLATVTAARSTTWDVESDVVIVTPAERIYVVVEESRVTTVGAQSRVTTVPAASRTTEVS